jgi:hypothetical protein
VHADASGMAVGATLSQSFEDGEHPVLYASKKLSQAERNYSTVDRELLSVAWAVSLFRPYLYGGMFTVVTDHKPLLGLMNSVNLSARQLRLVNKLSEYRFSLLHRSGATHQKKVPHWVCNKKF